MSMAGLTQISRNLYYDGAKLFDDGKVIPLPAGVERDLLELLLKHRGYALEYNAIFEAAIDASSKDHKSYVQKAISKLAGRSPSLKELITTVGDYGYQLKPETGFYLSPHFVRGIHDPSGLFPPCNNNIVREDVLSYIQENAFRETNIFAISGPPGMGKSEIVKAFLHQCCSRKDVPDRLKFENVFYTAYHQDGLKATIASFPFKGSCTPASRFENIKKQLPLLKKPVLLAIDNADSILKELESTPEYMKELLNDGIYFLIASRENLTYCPHVRCMELAEMETHRLETLFRKAAGPEWKDDSSEDLTKLIEVHLKKNTYLVTLAAGLMKTMSLAKLVQAFENPGQVTKLSHMTRNEKDGKKQPADTLMGHFKCLYNLQGLSASYQKDLLNLAMLPTEGMDNEEYFKRAFREDELVQARRNFQFLEDRHWVFLRNRIVSLHPMVRELVLEEAGIDYNRDVQNYLQNSADRLNHFTYSGKLIPELKFGTAAMDAMKIREEQLKKQFGSTINGGRAYSNYLNKTKQARFAAAQLTAQIASAYDTLTDQIPAYSYGIDAKKRLDDIKSAVSSYDACYRLAQCYSVTGYAILHYKKGEYLDIARETVESGARLVKELLSQPRTPQEQEDCQVLSSKIAGNLAACSQTEKDYETARDRHMQTLQDRLAVNEATEGKYNALVAAAHRSLGGDYYYLAGKMNPEENFRLSYENHKESVRYYSELDHTWKLDWCISSNRMIGTGLKIAETFDDEIRQDLLSAPLNRLLPEYLDTIHSMLSYLVTIPPMENELKDCIQNTTRILKLSAEEQILAEGRKVLALTELLSETVRKNLHSPLQALRETIG